INSHSDITILSAGTEVGGLVGYNYKQSLIDHCYSTGIVNGVAGVGGLVGYNHYASLVRNSYSRAQVDGLTSGNYDSNFGGFAGISAQENSTIENCYSTGTVSGGDFRVHGFVGTCSANPVIACFWDTVSSKIQISDGGSGLPTSLMKTQTTFTSAGWDFADIWAIDPAINDGYPHISGILSFTLPGVETGAISNVSCRSARVSGKITATGDPLPTQHGVCWANNALPTTANYKTELGPVADTLSFNCELSGLSPSRTYIVRAYAQNAAGTAYGDPDTLTTLTEVFIENLACLFIDTDSAAFRATVTSSGTPEISQYGICWSTDSNPDTADHRTNAGVGQTAGDVYMGVSGLSPNQYYYFRAYAVHANGIAYSGEIASTTWPVLPDAPIAGDGSSGDPYHIASLEQLFWIAADESRWDKHYVQTADINAAPVRGWFPGADGNFRGWMPVGYYRPSTQENAPFTGSYDGGSHAIDSLFIARPGESYIGLFGRANNAAFSSLRITNADISGNYNCGALAGQVSNSDILYCHVGGKVSGIYSSSASATAIGGLVGDHISSQTQHCSMEGSVSGTAVVGGLIGYISFTSVIEDCQSQTNINGVDNCGGLVGLASVDCRILNAHSSGSVHATGANIGGLVGQNHTRCQILECSSDGDVTASNTAGGLVGLSDDNSKIRNSRSSGTITASASLSRAGGLVGYLSQYALISDCSSDAAVNGYQNCGGLLGTAYLYSQIVRNSSSGSVMGQSYCGGLIGALSFSTVSNSWSSGTVCTNGNYTGGLCGYAYGAGIIHSYSRGKLDYASGSYAGGLLGYDNYNSETPVTASFWDIDSSGTELSAGGSGRTAVQMRMQSTYTDSGWNFTDVWAISDTANEGYPYLLPPVSIGMPELVSDSLGGITTASATAYYRITNTGSPLPEQHGVCWNTSGSPTTEDHKTLDGPVDSTGSYHSVLSSLSPNTQYYVRPYATNANGTVYGDELSFRTCGAPMLGSFSLSDIGRDRVTASAVLFNTGNPFVIQHGFCWNTNGNPDFANARSDKGPASSTGTFTSLISGLDENTRYFIRPYAINAVDSVYGQESSFFTLGPPSVQTLALGAIDSTGVQISGKLLYPGNPAATVYGFCWNTADDPDVGHYTLESESLDTAGVFGGQIAGLTANTHYYIRAYALNSVDTVYGEVMTFTTLETALGAEIPEHFTLSQNYPNPFNPYTTLKFGLPEVSDVHLAIYDLNGRKVQEWRMENQSAGWHALHWDARNPRSGMLPAGVYICSIRAGTFFASRKMLLLK
ncbi:MAG: GLUG motif-containing protein, partial [bacterium]|nr:GLUG motif-containing protein [bacterium]